MAAVHSFLTAERFAELYSDDSKPYFEYWFGEAVQKSTPTILHGVLQMTIGILLLRRGWFAAGEVRLKISKVAYPVPDIVANRSPLEDPYPTEPFDLCVEILSPGDKLREVFQKAAHYLDWGIGSVWIIDPKSRSAYQMTLNNPQPIPIGNSGELVAGSGEAEIRLSLLDIFVEAEKQLVRK